MLGVGFPLGVSGPGNFPGSDIEQAYVRIAVLLIRRNQQSLAIEGERGRRVEDFTMMRSQVLQLSARHVDGVNLGLWSAADLTAISVKFHSIETPRHRAPRVALALL